MTRTECIHVFVFCLSVPRFIIPRSHLNFKIESFFGSCTLFCQKRYCLYQLMLNANAVECHNFENFLPHEGIHCFSKIFASFVFKGHLFVEKDFSLQIRSE